MLKKKRATLCVNFFFHRCQFIKDVHHVISSMDSKTSRSALLLRPLEFLDEKLTIHVFYNDVEEFSKKFMKFREENHRPFCLFYVYNHGGKAPLRQAIFTIERLLNEQNKHDILFVQLHVGTVFIPVSEASVFCSLFNLKDFFRYSTFVR